VRTLVAAPASVTDHVPRDGAPATALVHLSDAQWARIADRLPVATGGRPAWHQRRHLDGLLWLRQTGASWRSLPAGYGSWKTLYACYRHWCATGTWQRLLELLANENIEVSL
jgi:transposase